MIKNVTVGADPEIFLFNEDGFVSAEGKFGGTKEKPKNIGRKGFSIQEDNVMVEFNIPPSNNLNDFQDNIEYMLDFITIGANQFDCTINKSASALFNEKYLDTDQAQTFGCDPDFNAYTMGQNEMIEVLDPHLRTCGGHIHIGYDEPNEMVSTLLIKAMDITLGLPSILKDSDTRRRSMYGKAGAYRLQPFGVEYRTLSNFWIFDKDLTEWVFNGIQAAVGLVNSGAISLLAGNAFLQAVPNVINKGDKRLAKNLLINISKTLKQQTVCVD